MKNKIHIHLDPIGGISGDMFIAAMIDAEDKLKNIAIETAKQAGSIIMQHFGKN